MIENEEEEEEEEEEIRFPAACTASNIPLPQHNHPLVKICSQPTFRKAKIKCTNRRTANSKISSNGGRLS